MFAFRASCTSTLRSSYHHGLTQLTHLEAQRQLEELRMSPQDAYCLPEALAQAGGVFTHALSQHDEQLIARLQLEYTEAFSSVSGMESERLKAFVLRSSLQVERSFNRKTILIEDRELEDRRLSQRLQNAQPEIIHVRACHKQPNWQLMRELADRSKARLVADLGPQAGFLLAQAITCPLPLADLLLIQTSGSLFGPSAWLALTADRTLAKALQEEAARDPIPAATAAALLATLGCIRSSRSIFNDLQRQTIENAKALRRGLGEEHLETSNGVENPYVVLDASSLTLAGKGKLDAATARMLLEQINIRVDLTGSGSRTALRFGLTCLTQRGIASTDLVTLGQVIVKTLAQAIPCQTALLNNTDSCKARLPFESIDKGLSCIEAIVSRLPFPEPNTAHVGENTVVLPITLAQRVGLLVRGRDAERILDYALSCNVKGLSEKECLQGGMFFPDGRLLDDPVLYAFGPNRDPALGPLGEIFFGLFPRMEKVSLVTRWLNALARSGVMLEPTSPEIGLVAEYFIEPMPAQLLNAEVRQLVDRQSPVNRIGELPSRALDFAKPWFIGQRALAPAANIDELRAFVPPVTTAVLRKTVLHGWHASQQAKLVPFGGWEMPVEYADGGIFAEHRAVRTAAGLFDVTHMTILEVSGCGALQFLENLLPNSPSKLQLNEAQYGYLLNAEGIALDDLYVYRVGQDRYFVVVNAANSDRDLAWLFAVQSGKVTVDPALPVKRLTDAVTIKNLRSAGADALLDLALQGPQAPHLLAGLAETPEQARRLIHAGFNEIFEVTLDGIPVWAARTGYTGERDGYELFVHPERTQTLWELLLERGRALGVRPCGLGARDSLRIEAGLPLFGHELEGTEALTLTEADYGFVLNLQKPYFVGKAGYMQRIFPRRKRLLRLHGQGRRSVRAGHAILDREGQAAGVVTSFAFADADFNFYVLASVRADFRPKAGEIIVAARVAPDRIDEVDASKQVPLKVLSRFPTQDEKMSWSEKYGTGLK